jgi:hypothetical protein
MPNLKADWWWQRMRSEIPQIEVVTAIADAESEDYVAQLLFSQDWNIIYRAFDGASLENFLQTRDPHLRTIVVFRSDLEGLALINLDRFRQSSITFISLDLVKITAHSVMTHIRQELRIPSPNSRTHSPLGKAADINEVSPQIHRASSEQSPAPKGQKKGAPLQAQRSNTYIRKARRVIAVTGSAGAPGRTRFSLALAQEVARAEPVLVVDADVRSQSLARQRDLYMSQSIKIAPLDVKQRPTVLPEGDDTVIVDLGTLPTLSETVTDRRWQGSLVNHVLDTASHVVYLTKSTPSSINELSLFLREFPVLLKAVPITYICILSGNSRSLREWEGKFMTLTVGESRFILRESQLESTPTELGVKATPSLPFIGQLMKPAQPHRKEIAKILASMM